MGSGLGEPTCQRQASSRALFGFCCYRWIQQLRFTCWAHLRSAAAETARNDWQRRQERDPVIAQMNLGFAIAVVFMTAEWNLRPERFMHFLDATSIPGTDQQRFQVVLVGQSDWSGWYRVDEVNRHPRNISE